MENIELWVEFRQVHIRHHRPATDICPSHHTEKGPVRKRFEIKTIIDRKLFKKFMKPEKLLPNAYEFLKQIDFFNSVRLSEELNTSMIITGTGAILFLRSGDSIDYSQCHYRKSESFLKWTKRIFDHLWEKALTIKPSAQKEK